MPWLRVDDNAADHPKVLRGGVEVFGFVALCAAWAAKQTTDGFIPDYVARRVSPDRWQDLIKAAQRAQYLGKPIRNAAGDRGWILDQTDQLLHMRSKEEVELDREKGKITRQKEAVREVRLRDGDQCRYCEKTVEWKDRVSARGGTYDHPDPTDRDTFVVACFGCNRSKSDRTPEQWLAADQRAHTLKPPPETPYIGPVTAERFNVPQTAPARTTTVETQPGSAAPASGDAAASTGNRSHQARPDGPGPICDLPGEVLQTYPGRDGSGSGQVGSGGAGSPRAGPPRKRGSRGGKRNPPPTKPT